MLRLWTNVSNLILIVELAINMEETDELWLIQSVFFERNFEIRSR